MHGRNAGQITGPDKLGRAQDRRCRQSTGRERQAEHGAGDAGKSTGQEMGDRRCRTEPRVRDAKQNTGQEMDDRAQDRRCRVEHRAGDAGHMAGDACRAGGAGHRAGDIRKSEGKEMQSRA